MRVRAQVVYDLPAAFSIVRQRLLRPLEGRSVTEQNALTPARRGRAGAPYISWRPFGGAPLVCPIFAAFASASPRRLSTTLPSNRRPCGCIPLASLPPPRGGAGRTPSGRVRSAPRNRLNGRPFSRPGARSATWRRQSLLSWASRARPRPPATVTWPARHSVGFVRGKSALPNCCTRANHSSVRLGTQRSRGIRVANC
jgi:hypothetical protein